MVTVKIVACFRFSNHVKCGLCLVYLIRRDAAAVNKNLQVRRLQEELEEANDSYQEVRRVCSNLTLCQTLTLNGLATETWIHIPVNSTASACNANTLK